MGRGDVNTQKGRVEDYFDHEEEGILHDSLALRQLMNEATKC